MVGERRSIASHYTLTTGNDVRSHLPTNHECLAVSHKRNIHMAHVIKELPVSGLCTMPSVA